MNKAAIGTPTMSDDQVAAWESMARDRTLKEALAEDAHYKRTLAKRMEALRRKREGLSV